MNMLDRSPEETSVETFDDDQARALIIRLNEDIAGWRAKLSLLLNAAIQYELDRVSESDGLEVIASVASMPRSALSMLLAGDYRPTAKTWAQIERVLVLCQASRGMERVTTARRYFDRIAELSQERNRAVNRRVELARRTTETGKAAAGKARSGPGQDASLGKPATDTAENKAAAEPSTAEEGDASEPSRTPAAIPDLHGHEQRPDPLLAKTPSMFVAAMRAYNAWAGNLSYREMERRCDKQISYSTFRNMLNAETLPKLASLEIFVRVLGGSPEYLQAWATAWRQIAMDDFKTIGRERRRVRTL